MKSMGSLKAPSPYKYQALFFKKTWDRTGPTLNSFVQWVLKGEEVPLEATKALLVLIPKEDKPSIRSFQLVCLCNLSTKLMTKVIFNRLKAILNRLIASNQTSFTLGRYPINNVVMCQEIVHSLRYTIARRCGMVMELDLEKTYDLMEQWFVKDTLRDTAIPNSLVVVIMGAIGISHCKPLWKREISELSGQVGVSAKVIPSPHIFSSRALSNWEIGSKVRCSRVDGDFWKHLKGCQGVPPILRKWFISICWNLRGPDWLHSWGLKSFCKTSGQLINFS